MNFMEAVKAMAEGKKLTRDSSEKIHQLDGDRKISYTCRDDDVVRYFIIESDINSNEWEIVDEKKTLSDHIKDIAFEGPMLDVDFLKEALKKLIEGYGNDLGGININIFSLKKIFGDRLIENDDR